MYNYLDSILLVYARNNRELNLFLQSQLLIVDQIDSLVCTIYLETNLNIIANINSISDLDIDLHTKSVYLRINSC